MGANERVRNATGCRKVALTGMSMLAGVLVLCSVMGAEARCEGGTGHGAGPGAGDVYRKQGIIGTVYDRHPASDPSNPAGNWRLDIQVEQGRIRTVTVTQGVYEECGRGDAFPDCLE